MSEWRNRLPASGVQPLQTFAKAFSQWHLEDEHRQQLQAAAEAEAAPVPFAPVPFTPVPLAPALLRSREEHDAIISAAWQGVLKKRSRRSRSRSARSRSTHASSGSKGQVPGKGWAQNVSSAELSQMMAAKELTFRADHAAASTTPRSKR